MSKLQNLRFLLASLRARRGGVRVVTALCALLIGVLWCLGVVFLIDVIFEMTVLQRIATFVVALGVLVWVYVRYAAPWLGISESIIDMPFMVENKQKI